MRPSRRETLPERIRVAGWLVERDTCRFTRGDEQVHVRPLLVDLLLLLARHAGEVVTKDVILERLWEGRLVSDSLLTRTMAELRRLMGDSARRARVIETVSKRGYRLVAPVAACPRHDTPRVAVLIFDNLNRDPEQDYFAEGISDALITELGRIGSLRVISRQSVLRMRGTSLSLSDVARDLDVDAVVEGTALRAESRVRITAQLIQADPEQHLWADSYECALDDVLAVQARIARTIAESVRAVLSPADLARLSAPRRVDPTAHLEYLKALHHSRRWTPSSTEKAFAHLDAALQHDPLYAPAHGLMAECLGVLGFWGHMPPAVAYPRAKLAAQTAVQHDDSCGRAHAILGFLKWHLDWDLDGCERELRRAIELNPSSEYARMSYAMFLRIVRRERARALAEARAALELDPLSLDTSFGYGWFLVFVGDYDGAARQARATLDMHPDSTQALYVAGFADLCRSRFAEAASSFERAVSLGRDAYSLAGLAYAYGRSGRTAQAEAILDELSARSRQAYVPEYAFFWIRSGLGDVEGALRALARCAANRDSQLFWAGLLPEFELLYPDPRLRDLLARAGIPAVILEAIPDPSAHP